MATTYPQLVLFGDSLLQGSIDIQDGFSFQAALQTRLIRRLDVVNRGFAGWTSKNALEYLPKIFPALNDQSPKLDYLIVLFGANDAIVPHPASTRHVSVDDYKLNLIRLINHVHIRSHRPKILLVTPTPVDEDKLNSLGHEPRTLAHTRLYAEAVREVAKENSDIILIDLWQAVVEKATHTITQDIRSNLAAELPAANFDGLFIDGLHLSAVAYKLFYDLVTPYLPEGHPSQYVYPDWKDLVN
ncbi:SGNH-hydro domain-containing protein [Fusarium sp. Ph1]|nr:SGNH-hydro domain-containing protein [Fusarium sp. Ph1]